MTRSRLLRLGSAGLIAAGSSGVLCCSLALQGLQLSSRAAEASAPPPPPAVEAAPATATLTSLREIVLDLSERTISLTEQGKVLGSWPVAIGDSDTPTPTGRFQVRNKVINPQYQSTSTGKLKGGTGPESPLGDRWIGFHTNGNNQFGIHGTPNAWSWAVKQRAAVTHGCVRMLGPHVRFLFDQIDIGTPVVVKR